MTTLAGQLFNGTQANPQWVPCNGQPLYVLYSKQPQGTRTALSEGNRADYVRQVGWQGRRRGLGPLGWIICMPFDPLGTWVVSTADNQTETALTPPVPTVGKPPAGIK